MTFDIRTKSHDEIKEIRFSDSDGEASTLSRDGDEESVGGVYIRNTMGTNELELESEEDALWLLKSIEYALEQGWWEYQSNVDGEGDV